MTTRSAVRSSRLAGLFSLDLLDGLHVRLRRPHRREASAGFGLKRLAKAFTNTPGLKAVETGRQVRSRIALRFIRTSILREDSFHLQTSSPATHGDGPCLCRMRKQSVRQGRSNARRRGHIVLTHPPRACRDKLLSHVRTLSSVSDARTPAAGRFRILHRLVVFGIDDVQTGRPAGGQELLIGADDRKPKWLQLQRQGQMQQLR